MEPPDVAQYRVSRERLSTKLGEPVRGVVAARIVAAFVFLGGFSVLTLHERSAAIMARLASYCEGIRRQRPEPKSPTSVCAAAAFARGRANYQPSATAATG